MDELNLGLRNVVLKGEKSGCNKLAQREYKKLDTTGWKMWFSGNCARRLNLTKK